MGKFKCYLVRTVICYATVRTVHHARCVLFKARLLEIAYTSDYEIGHNETGLFIYIQQVTDCAALDDILDTVATT